MCGQPGPLLDTIPEAVKTGAIPAGNGRGRDAQLVSVNKPAQGRGGKLQLGSAPVCDRCGSAAMSVLNALLADNSPPVPDHRQRADLVAARDSKNSPGCDWINEPELDQVSKLISELHKPHRPPAVGGVDPNAFYAVTLSVNQSRVVVRDWLEVPVDEVQRKLGRAGSPTTGSPTCGSDGPQLVPLWLLTYAAGRWGTENGQGRYLAAGDARMAARGTCCSPRCAAPARRATCCRTCCSASALTAALTCRAPRCCA